MRYELPNLQHWPITVIRETFTLSDLKEALRYLEDCGPDRNAPRHKRRWMPGREMLALGMNAKTYTLEEWYAIKHRLQFLIAEKEGRYDNDTHDER
jgi:hypothetical protein